MSLKQNLTEYLQTNGRITLDQLYLLCGKEHKKVSNAERRFRELMSPLHKDFNPKVGAERNAKGAIVAYYWTDGGGERVSRWPHKPEITGASPVPRTTCCNSYKIFQEHAQNCPTRVKVEVNKLF